MTLTQIEYILAVAKEQSFRGAAKSRFVTQPTLSMQIQKLEEELGVVIFDRSRSPILPTKVGALIIQPEFPANHLAVFMHGLQFQIQAGRDLFRRHPQLDQFTDFPLAR